MTIDQVTITSNMIIPIVVVLLLLNPSNDISFFIYPYLKPIILGWLLGKEVYRTSNVDQNFTKVTWPIILSMFPTKYPCVVGFPCHYL